MTSMINSSRSRRANGESSIFKGADGRWHGWVSCGTAPDGRRRRRHVSAKTRVLVVQKVRAAEAERDLDVRAPGVTVAVWLSYWVSEIQPRRVRPRTLDGYTSLIDRHVTPSLGRLRLAQVTPDHLEGLYTRLLAGGLSASTVLRVHRLLARAFKVAVQRGVVARNVTALVDPPRVPRADVARPLSADEARAVLATAASERNAARWTVALALGLRQSEVLGLQWRDIDLAAGSLTVRRTQHEVAGVGITYAEPKTDRSRRTLALPPMLVQQLAEHRRVQAVERETAGSVWEEHDAVFAQPNGRPVGRKVDYTAWCRLLERAGVRHVRLHDARHTTATLLLAEGIQARVVMDLLGHSQMRTTTDLYSHVMPALAREAADKMGRVLGP